MSARFLIVYAFAAFTCLTAASNKMEAQTVSSNPEAVIVEDYEDPDIDCYVPTPAEKYYEERGRKHPVDDVIGGNDYQAMLDSCNVVLELFPDDYYSLSSRSFAGYKLGNVDQSISDALKLICRDETAVDKLPFSIVDYYVALDPAAVKRQLRPYIGDNVVDDWVRADEMVCLNLYRMFMAECENNLNNKQEAYRIAKIVFKSTGYYEDGLIMMTTLLLKNGTPEAALRIMNPYVNDDSLSSSAFLNNYILALRDSGQGKKAGNIMKKKIKNSDSIDENLFYKKEYAILLGAIKDYKKAIKLLDEVIKACLEQQKYYDVELYDPYLTEALLRKGIYEINLGNVEKGKEDIKASLRNGSLSDEDTGFEITALAYLGEKEKVFEKIADFSDEVYKASIHSIFGNYNEAIKLLEKAFEDHSWSPQQIAHDPNFDSLVKTPGYQTLLAKFKPLDLESTK